MDLFDWMFIVSGFIFFVSMISAILLMTYEKIKTVKIFGLILAILMLPIIAILINYIVIGDLKFNIYLILILSYLMAEFLLDMVFKFDFRSKTSTHVPYIILEYAACFSFVFGTLTLDLIFGWIISFFFWTLLGTLVHHIIKQKKKIMRHNSHKM